MGVMMVMRSTVKPSLWAENADSDGCTDCEEAVSGVSDPIDTDGDGCLDCYEITSGSDPYDPIDCINLSPDVPKIEDLPIWVKFPDWKWEWPIHRFEKLRKEAFSKNVSRKR